MHASINQESLDTHTLKPVVGILSVGILSVGVLSAGISSVGILSSHHTTRYGAADYYEFSRIIPEIDLLLRTYENCSAEVC